MGINTSVNSGAVNYTSKSNSNVTKKVQVSGWEVAAGISASTDEVKLEELNVDENINSINSESFQKLADFVQQKCVNQRDTISFDELKKTDEFKQLLTECGFEEISFDSYVQYKKWEQLQIVNQELSEGKKNLTEITKTRKNFYDEVTEILGQDLNYTLTEYNNEVSVTLNNYEGDFTNNLQRVVEGGRISDEQDLETYSKIIFEVLNKSESTSYTQDDIKNALSGKNDNFSDIYNEYTNNIENLREVLKSNYPPMTSAIEALEQQYNKKLEGSNLTISDVNDTLKMYDFYIAQIEQQNQVNEQNKIQLSYSVIMETNDYKNFNEDTSYEQKLKKYITNQITNTNQVSYEKYQEEYPNSNISPLQFYKCVYENYKDFTVSINGISGKEKEQMKNLLEASKYDPDLLKMYNYIYCTQGIDAANKYIKNTESNVNEIIAQVNVQSMLDDMKLDKEYTITLDGKKYNYSIAIKDGKLAIKGLGDGIENFFNGLKGWFNSSETKTVEEWEQYYFLLSIMKEEDKKANGLIDENGNSTSQYIDFSKDYYSIGGQEVYNISSSIGNMLPSMLLSTINPMLGTVALGTSAGGNSFRDAVTSGYDISKAIMYGLASGISEAALERLLGSIPGLGKTDETFVPNISTWLKSCYNEGKEEFIQEGFDILLRGVIFGEEIDLAEAIKQMGVAGVYGAITGGIMNGVAFPFKAANLDANLEIIAEANDGTLTNAQIAEMFGTTEKYVSEFMEERKSKNTTQNTTQNTNAKESKNTSVSTKTARETTQTIKQELNITDPKFDGILSQIGYKVQAGKITMEEAKGIANVYKELGYYSMPLKYGQDIYEISIKTEGKYSIQEIFEVYNQGNSVLSQEDIIEIINKTYDQSQQTTRRYVNYYSNVFDSFGKENYGVDQGGIKKLSTFWYNGKQYTYTEAMQLIERAKYNGEVIPNFYEQKTTEYNELKNKLIGKYNFNEVEASIIMNTVDDAGACSYASVCNEIFSSFIGKESEFLQAFGYPMYKYENGNIKFNSNELLLDLYVFANMRENGGNFIIKKNDGTYTLNRTYLNLNRKDPTGRFLLQADNYQKYMSTISGKNNKIINSFLNSKGYSYESKTITTGYSNNAITQQNVNDVYNHICNGGTASLGIYDGDSEIKMISCDPRSYPSQTTKNWNGGGHSIFITGIANNGFIVSSWGKKYIIPFADLTSTARFTLVLTNVK